MKTLGIIGGIAPDSTVDYYRSLVAGWREQRLDGSYPRIFINSIDMQRMRTLVEQDALPELVAYLLEEVQKLARAGVDFALLASNTPHLVFDELRQQSPVSLLSIVECACDAAESLGLKRVGLLGTRFTMGARFYPDAFSRKAITLVVPEAEEQAWVHDKYMNELVNGRFLPETREGFLTLVGRMITEEKIEAVVLGGTELPLLLRGAQSQGIPFLDTTQIHVRSALKLMLS